MKHVLFVLLGLKGEINQRIPVVQWLQKLGHKVTWLTPCGIIDDQLGRAGIEVVTLDTPGHQITPALSGEARASIVHDDEASLRRDRSFYIDDAARLVDPVREAIRRIDPDVVVHDGLLYCAAIASHLEGKPNLNIAGMWMLVQPPTLDYPMMDRVRAISADRVALFAKYGMKPEFRALEAVSPFLNTVFTTEAMVGPCPHRPARTHLIGPSLPVTQRGDELPFDWSLLDESLPLVYLSFGSRVYWQPALILKIADAAAVLGVQLLVSAGDLATSDFVLGLPGNVVAAAYLPQLAVLERASVFITHAGSNSVSEAMYYGVPLLAMPICNEEPVQAHYVEQAKVGLQLEPFSCTAAQIEQALRQLLDASSDCRSGIPEVMRSYRESDGARRAAELIVSFEP